MISILKYLRGYVQIKIWGFAPERFLNLCSSKNILLWDIKKDGDVYYLCISLKGFRKLKTIAHKTRTRVVILKRYGLPFLIPGVLSRKVFLAGLFAACFFWFWTSFYVWEISIDGNYAITEDVFMKFLKEQGVQVGIRAARLDIEQLEKDIRREFKEITWTSAKLSGTKLYISVKENDAILSVVQEEGFSDLYAEKEGVIISMIVRSGVPQAAIGDSVEQGTLLVSGRVPVFNEDATIKKYQYTKADADIVVERTRKVYETLPFYYIKKEYTGREKKKYYVGVSGKEFTFGRENGFTYYDVVGDNRKLALLKGLTLPLSFGSYLYREYQNVECVYSLEEAEQILKERYQTLLTELEKKGVSVISEKVRMDSERGVWVLKGELTVREQIGQEVPIEEGENFMN